MTVCIAAIATGDHGEEYIVAASDKMLSTQEFSGDDIAMKSHFIAEEWALMWAAEDASQVTPIWEIARGALYPKRLHVHCPEVADTVARAYQRQLREEATARFLSRYGLSMADFLKEGGKLFPQAQYEEMHREIRAVRLGCDFLGFGFDDSAHIFRVSEPGKITYEDEVGFAAIGSGWYSAISTLFFHSVNRMMPLWEVVYHVLEAKFMAESAPGVGAETFAQVLDSDGNSDHLFSSMIDNVRDLWWKGGMPRVPKKGDEKIMQWMKECKEEQAKMDKEIQGELKEKRKRLARKGKEIAKREENQSEDTPKTKKAGAGKR